MRFQYQPGRAMAQAVNCRTLTPEASDLRHFIGICGRQSGIATGICAVLRLPLSASFHQFYILVHLSFFDAFSVGISSLNNTFFSLLLKSHHEHQLRCRWFPVVSTVWSRKISDSLIHAGSSSILLNSHGYAIMSLDAM